MRGPGAEWLRRRELKHRRERSVWLLIRRIIALIVIVWLIHFFATGGPDRWSDYLTRSEHSETNIIITDPKEIER
jgi:hypothetical protein